MCVGVPLLDNFESALTSSLRGSFPDRKCQEKTQFFFWAQRGCSFSHVCMVQLNKHVRMLVGTEVVLTSSEELLPLHTRATSPELGSKSVEDMPAGHVILVLCVGETPRLCSQGATQVQPVCWQCHCQLGEPRSSKSSNSGLCCAPVLWVLYLTWSRPSAREERLLCTDVSDHSWCPITA